MPRLTIDGYIKRATHLPPAPRILPQLLILLNQPNADSGRLVELIAHDPGLTASVLRLCNSALVGNALPTSDLREAVIRLGFAQVFRLVAAISGAPALNPAQPGYGFNVGELWRHSVTAAVAAQMVARELHENETLVFTATLLHDIGKVILADALRPLHPKLFRSIEQSHASMLEAEEDLLGVQHAEVGARVLELWKLPENLVQAVRFHHQPLVSRPHERLASLVYLGNLLAYLIGQGYGLYAFALRQRAEAMDILELDPGELPRLMMRTIEELEAVEALLRND